MSALKPVRVIKTQRCWTVDVEGVSTLETSDPVTVMDACMTVADFMEELAAFKKYCSIVGMYRRKVWSHFAFDDPRGDLFSFHCHTILFAESLTDFGGERFVQCDFYIQDAG